MSNDKLTKDELYEQIKSITDETILSEVFKIIDNKKQEALKAEVEDKLVVKLKSEDKEIDKQSDKYQILLKFINKLLKNIGKEEITDLTQFQNIDREEIIKEENKLLFKKMEKEMHEFFNKSKTGYYRRKRTKHYILTFIRSVCDEIGLKFFYTEKTRSVNSLVKTHIIYSIK